MTDRPSRKLSLHGYIALRRRLINEAASGGEQPTGVGSVMNENMHSEAQ